MVSNIVLNGARLVADPSGALVWPEQSTIVVADLHLEKGSAYARKGTLLPPYDSAATLARLTLLVEAHQPARVLCLGDSFHDGDAAGRLTGAERRSIDGLTRRTDWVWIEGNHDPKPPQDLGGRVASEIVVGPLVFRHQSRAGVGEISGHLHPKAYVQTRGGQVAGRCFVEDGQRLIMPAFGAFTGGLDVLDPAIRVLMGPAFCVHVIGRDRVHRFARRQLC
jgi:uncharacterized protein